MANQLPYEPILDHVVFTFDEGVHDGQFTEENIGSIMMYNKGKNFNHDAEYSRWGTVTAIGPLVTEVKVGDHVVVEKHKWTPEFTVDGHRVWRTNEKNILAVEEQD